MQQGALGDILKETQREQILNALEQSNWVLARPGGSGTPWNEKIGPLPENAEAGNLTSLGIIAVALFSSAIQLC